MCGIVGGWFAFDGSQLRDSLNLALEAMRLRGPNDRGAIFIEDSNGTIALGHTRLSIIDLSSGGHQPMESACGRYSIIFNGEIYNYLELRAELKDLGAVFITNSDTEVLLAAWMRWGATSLSKLSGMFAFVVLDRGEQTLTCVRDAFGIKPLFYSQESSRFIFASELKALQLIKAEKCELNWQTSYDYLMYGAYDSNNQTFIENIEHLLPGHLLVFDAKKRVLSQPVKWWNPDRSAKDIGFKDATEMLREIFLKSIRLHLRSDVPVGAALSGGLDSSSVVCAIRYLDKQIPINTFSYIARGSPLSEEGWVDQVNQFVGAKSYKILVSPEEMMADLDDMILAQGEPFGTTSIYAQYRVFREAKNSGVLVTLDGQGADELLAGYSGFPGQRIHSLIDKGEYLKAYQFLLHWSAWPGRSFSGGLKRLVGELTKNSGFYTYLRKMNGEGAGVSWLNESMLLEHGVKLGFPTKQKSDDLVVGRRLMETLYSSLTLDGLPSLLRHADRNSMRFSVESRVPFLTTEMAEFLLSLPESYLVDYTGETKHIFRAAMKGIVPENILYRKDKVGFETPQSDWLNVLMPQLKKWVSCDPSIPFLNHDSVLAYFDSAIKNPLSDTSKIWRLVNFYRWYKQFLLK